MGNDGDAHVKPVSNKPMLLKGADVDGGLREWIKEEFKSGPGREYDSGKFFFTVSSATIGFIFAAAKLSGAQPIWRPSLIFSFALLLFSTLVAIYMVVPRGWEIDTKTDLFDKRNGIIKRIEKEIFVWLFLWIIGASAGMFTLIR